MEDIKTVLSKQEWDANAGHQQNMKTVIYLTRESKLSRKELSLCPQCVAGNEQVISHLE